MYLDNFIFGISTLFIIFIIDIGTLSSKAYYLLKFFLNGYPNDAVLSLYIW